MGSAFSTLNSWIHAVQTLRSGYLLTWGWLFGSNIWMSYISGPIAYTTIPRQQFGLLQSKLFPPYFYGSAILSAALFLGDIKLRPILYQQLKSKPFSTSYSMISSGSFWMSTAGLALATTTLHLANAVVVGPKATEVMFRRHRLERSGSGGKATDPHGSDMDKLNKEFGTLHSISTVLNMASTVTTGLIGWKIGHVGLGLAGWS